MHGGRESACALCLGACVHPCLACTGQPVSGHTHGCSRSAPAHPIRWSAWRFPRTARTAAAGRNGATATGRCAPWDGAAWRSAAAAAAAGIGPGRVIVRVVRARHRFGLLSCCAYCHELLSWSLCLEGADDLRLLLLIVWFLALNCLTLLPIVSRLLRAWCLRAVFSMAKSLLCGVLTRSTACACVLSPGHAMQIHSLPMDLRSESVFCRNDLSGFLCSWSVLLMPQVCCNVCVTKVHTV